MTLDEVLSSANQMTVADRWARFTACGPHDVRALPRTTTSREDASAARHPTSDPWHEVIPETIRMEAGPRNAIVPPQGGSIAFDDSGIAWRGHRLSASQLARARGLAIRSFGSCSFREPIDDLTSLGML